MGSRRAIMHYIVFCLLLPFLGMYLTFFSLRIFDGCFFRLVVSLEIDSKLDFGDDQSKAIIQEPGVAVLQNSDAISVQCGSGGCNVTKNETNTESISTDVLVHIKTKVQLVNSTNNQDVSSTLAPEDTPDVPIVVGYEGISQDQRKPFNPSGPSEEGKYYNKDNNNPLLPPLTDEEQKVRGVVNLSSKEDSLNDVRYKENGIPMHAPYFGENPTQRYVWYPRNSGVYGSYDNRRVWTVGPPQSRSQVQIGEERTCLCRKVGNQWYAVESIESRKAPTFRQPGAQINDKIEPLN